MTEYDEVEDGMTQIFLSLFAYLHAHLKGKLDLDDLNELARKVLASMGFRPNAITWATASSLRVRDVRFAKNLNSPMRIVGTFAEIDDPQLVTVPISSGKKISGTKDIEATCGRIIDSSLDSIETLDIVGGDLVHRLHDLHRQSCPIEFLCSPVAVPVVGDRKVFRLYVVDARRSVSTLDFLGATAKERSGTSELLQTLKDPLAFIVGELARNLRIVGLEAFPLLRDLLEFSALQALSIGRIDHAPARLHLLLVGPPGQGKKLVNLAARALNPCSVEVSNAKVSPAGLIGASFRSATGWTSTPGVLPRAAGGVAVLQDAHAWSEATVAKLGPLLQQVIEDGRVSDTVAGGQVREVPVSLTIDLNRLAHLKQGGFPVGREAAILRLRPLISRVDLIAEMPEDVLRAWKVSSHMYESLRAGTSQVESQPWVRQLQLLIALLRDDHPTIELGPVQEAMRMAHDQIGKQNEHLFALMPEAGDIPARMVITFARLVSASARSRNTGVAGPEDVRLALKFIEMKLSFLRFQVPAGLTEAAFTGTPTEWVATHAGMDVKTSDLVDGYQEKTGTSVTEQTIRRAFKALGARRTGKGQYLLPPAKKDT